MTANSMRVGFALVPDDPFWVQVREAARQRATELGVTLVLVPLVIARVGDESLDFLEDLKAQELGALITPFLNQSQMLSILEAGLPVICSDETPLRHPLLVSPQGLYDAAALATRYLAEQLGGQGHLLLVGGPEQNPYTGRIRVQGFRDTVAQFPGLRYDRIPTMWRYEEVYAQIVEEAENLRFVSAGRPVDAIFGISDPVALAARDAGRALGMADDHTLIAGVNGDPLAIASILEGTMHATVVTSPRDLGHKLVEFGLRGAQREALPDTFPFSTELVTAANVAQVAARKLVDIAALPSRLVDVNIQQEKQRLQQMETSLEINRHVGSILDEDELLHTLAGIIRSRYAYDRVQFFVWLDAQQSLALVEPGKTAAERLVLPLHEAGALAQALLRNQAVYIPHTLTSQRFAPDPRWLDLRARVILPMRVGGRTVGLLDLHSRNRTLRNQAELDALQALADQTGSAMRNAQLYAQALASKAEAEWASKMKSQLLASISHELRGPLNVILGYSRAAQATPNPYGADLPAELVHDLRYIERSGAGLLRLINGMLDLAQAEAGALPLYPERIDTQHYLAQLFADASQALATDGEVQWRLQVPTDLPAISVDPIRLHSVLLNLLDNAVKFTSSGQISLSAYCTDTHLCIAVQDTGCGIAPAALAEIRQGWVTEVAGGIIGGANASHTGLGLSIAHHLVALHGGTFAIESELGRGTRCQLELPLRPVVQDDHAGVDEPTSGTPVVHDRASHSLVQKAQEYVAANYVATFTRQELADALGVSDAYVSRAFKRVTGIALWDYVHQYRIRSACELLDRTAMSITEIALAVGFNDPAYFTRVFRKETGQSPQVYRRRSTALRHVPA